MQIRWIIALLGLVSCVSSAQANFIVSMVNNGYQATGSNRPASFSVWVSSTESSPVLINGFGMPLAFSAATDVDGFVTTIFSSPQYSRQIVGVGSEIGNSPFSIAANGVAVLGAAFFSTSASVTVNPGATLRLLDVDLTLGSGPLTVSLVPPVGQGRFSDDQGLPLEPGLIVDYQSGASSVTFPAAVPEPSSVLFLGMTGVLVGAGKWWSSRRNKLVATPATSV